MVHAVVVDPSCFIKLTLWESFVSSVVAGNAYLFHSLTVHKDNYTDEIYLNTAQSYNAFILPISIYKADIYLTLICIKLLLCTITLKLLLENNSYTLQAWSSSAKPCLPRTTEWGRHITCHSKKTVSSAIWVQTVCLVSYVSFCLTTAVVVITGLLTPSVCLAVWVTFSVVLSNSLS